jgi:GNAT superfamily N-acetyltransferase
MIPDGYTNLAPGKIASVVTYLEMTERPAQPAASSTVRLRRIEHPSLDWYRSRYKHAGTQWLWFSRLEISDEQLASLLQRPTTEVLIAEHEAPEAKEVGLAELDRSDPLNVEITSFALFPEWFGKGLGRAFMEELLARAWTTTRTGPGPVSRVWLHTCTLDSPAALAFYLKCGFRAYKRAIEVADDPRIRGILPENAAPHVPVIR